RLVDLRVVVLAIPADDERYVDPGEAPRPLLLLLAFDLDIERLDRLLELLEQQHGVEAGAAAEGREQHLGGAHRRVVTEDGRLVDADGVAGGGFDVELDLLARPASRDPGHGRTITRPRLAAWETTSGLGSGRWRRTTPAPSSTPRPRACARCSSWRGRNPATLPSTWPPAPGTSRWRWRRSCGGGTGSTWPARCS